MLTASFRRLEVFKTVVECGGVNAAADELGIAQPSVSAHIHALERQIGSPLFRRERGRTRQTTSVGQTFYAYACETLAKAQTAHLELRKLQSAEQREFILGCQRTLANHVLPVHLARFLESRSATQISVHSKTQDTLEHLLRASLFDVCVMLARAEATAYNSEVVGRETLVIIAAPDHPLAGRRRLAPARLNEWAFVGGLKTSQFFVLIRAAMRQIGIADCRFTLHLQDTVSVKQAVQHHVGLACTLASAVRAEVAAGTLVILDVAAPAMSLPVVCAYRASDRLPKIAAEFVQYVKTSRVFGSLAGNLHPTV